MGLEKQSKSHAYMHLPIGEIRLEFHSATSGRCESLQQSMFDAGDEPVSPQLCDLFKLFRGKLQCKHTIPVRTE